MFGNFFLKSLNLYIKKIEKIGLGNFEGLYSFFEFYTLGDEVVCLPDLQVEKKKKNSDSIFVKSPWKKFEDHIKPH